MNGPEHYVAAEQLLKLKTRFYNGGQTRSTEAPTPVQVARAQAHATLALAAATIDAASGSTTTGESDYSTTESSTIPGNWDDWTGVLR